MGTPQQRLLELSVELDQHFVLLAAALGVAIEQLRELNDVLNRAKGVLGQATIPANGETGTVRKV